MNARALIAALLIAGCGSFDAAYDQCVERGKCVDASNGGGGVAGGAAGGSSGGAAGGAAGGGGGGGGSAGGLELIGGLTSVCEQGLELFDDGFERIDWLCSGMTCVQGGVTP